MLMAPEAIARDENPAGMAAETKGPHPGGSLGPSFRRKPEFIHFKPL